MRYQHIIQAVYGHPWLITPQAWYGIHEIVLHRILNGKDIPVVAADSQVPAGEAGSGRHASGKRPNKDIFGDPIEHIRDIDGVTIVPVKGVLIKGAGLLDKMCGACSHEDIHEDLEAAVEKKPRAILLDFNCPGGEVTGTCELADHVAAIAQTTPIYSYTETQRCSAAEWIGAGCTGIFATESSYVGSIGVIWETYNVARALEAAGIDPHVFASGKYKAMGHPDIPMPKHHADWMQAHVEALGAKFRGHMTKHRDIARKDMEGQVFTGEEAARNGLVDATVPNLAAVLALLAG